MAGCFICGYEAGQVKKMFHFPKEVDKSRKWQEAMGIKYTGQSLSAYKICSRHFPKHCYHNKSYRLRVNAVPTLFPKQRMPKQSPNEVRKGRINAPTEYFELGSCFKSYKELLSKLIEHCRATKTKFFKIRARRINSKLREASQRLIYSDLKFSCVHNTTSTKKETRNFKPRCPAYFDLKMIESGRALQITAMNSNHNHPIEENYKVTRQRKIDQDADEVLRYLQISKPTEKLQTSRRIEIETDDEDYPYEGLSENSPQHVMNERDNVEDWRRETEFVPQNAQLTSDDDEFCQLNNTLM